MPDKTETVQNLVLFDGLCVLCDESMRFLFRQDRHRRLWYASLQGKLAEELRRRHPTLPEGLNSVILVENFRQKEEKIYLHSDAALKIAQKLSGGWGIISWGLVIPQPLRNAVYSWVARNRYHWFGRKESCSLPGPEMRARYLEE